MTSLGSYFNIFISFCISNERWRGSASQPGSSGPQRALLIAPRSTSSMYIAGASCWKSGSLEEKPSINATGTKEGESGSSKLGLLTRSPSNRPDARLGKFLLKQSWGLILMRVDNSCDRFPRSPRWSKSIICRLQGTNKRSWRTDETVLRLHIIPAIGSLAIDQVSSSAVSALIGRMRDKGYAVGTTNRVFILLRYIFNLARKWNVPGGTNNPTNGLSLAPETQRERFLSIEEAQRLLAALETDENQTAAKAIALLLLTGARRNEVTQARWEYIDWESKTLLVPVAKSGRPRRISLNGPAIDLLRSVAQQPLNPFIFPSPITGRPCPSLFFPWSRIRKRAGLPDVRLHDLRHSFASFLVNQGVSLYVVQGLLGHTQPRATQRYAHLAQQTLLEAAEVMKAVMSG